MATLTQVYNAVYDECVDIIELSDDEDGFGEDMMGKGPFGGSSDSYVDDGTKHVVYEDADLPERPPAIALNISDQPPDVTVGQAKVIEEITDSNGGVIDYVYAKEQDATFTATAMAESQSVAADVYTRLKRIFSGYESIVDSTNLHPDIGGVEVGDGSPGGRSTADGMILTITIEYTVTFRYTDLADAPFTPVTDVDMTVEGTTRTVN